MALIHTLKILNPSSMPDPSNSPLSKIRIPRPREERPILLLRRLLVPHSPSPLSYTALLLLPPPRLLLLAPRRLLPLLAVHDQESEKGSQAQDDDALHDAVVKVERVAAGHGVVLVEVVVEVIVVLGAVVLKKVVDPVGQ
jgi:hypothetical protein